MDPAKLQTIVDVIFTAAGEFLPLPGRLILKLLKNIVDNRVVPQLAERFRAETLSFAAPDQLRFVVNQLLSLLKDQLTDPTLLALVDSLGTFISGALLDLIWDKIVPSSKTDVIGTLDPVAIQSEADTFVRSLSDE